MKTLIMTFLFPVLLDVFSQIDLFLPLAKDPFLSSLLSGCLLGIGSGIILRANGSSGGFDILGVVLNKKCKIPVSVVMYVCDCTVILLQAVSKPLLQTVYGIIVILCTSIMVNKVITYGRSEVQLLIFSSEHEKIRQELLDTFDLGLTFLHAEGGYHLDPAKVILTILPYHKINDVKKDDLYHRSDRFYRDRQCQLCRRTRIYDLPIKFSMDKEFFKSFFCIFRILFIRRTQSFHIFPV